MKRCSSNREPCAGERGGKKKKEEENKERREENVPVRVRPGVASVGGRLPADQRRDEGGQRYPNRDERSQRFRKGDGLRGARPLGRETRRGEIPQLDEAEAVHHPVHDHHLHLRATFDRQERVQQHLEGEQRIHRMEILSMEGVDGCVIDSSRSFLTLECKFFDEEEGAQGSWVINILWLPFPRFMEIEGEGRVWIFI